MSEFVKKTVEGYWPVPGGHSDPECTHAILTLQEYNELLRKISAAEQDARAARRKADKDILAVKECRPGGVQSLTGGPGKGGCYPGRAGG